MVRARATRADAVERVLLLLLALVLPFELTTPVLAIRALAITNVEVVWYLLLLVAAIRWLRTGPPRWSVVHKAIVLWAAVIVLSAMVAPILPAPTTTISFMK